MSFDRNNPEDLETLKTEVETDPNVYGYYQSDIFNGILAPINLKRAEITVSKQKISSALIRSTTTYDAYNNLSIDEQEWIRWMTGSNGFEEENLTVTPDFRLNLLGDGGNSIWAVGDRTEMEAAMLGLIDFEGSRAEQLFGYATVINADDWRAARES